MADLITAPATRTVRTSDRRWTISWPLPKPRGRVTPHAGQRRLSTVKREMNRLLNLGHEVVCPITGQLVKIYRRTLHRSQVRTLERLRDKSDKLGKTWLHLEFFASRRDGDLAKLEAWGLARRLRPESRLEAEQVRGVWRITDRGRAWLAGQLRIPREVAILCGEVLGYVDEQQLVSPENVPESFSRTALLAGDHPRGAA